MDINPSGGTMTYNKNDANKGDYTDGYIYKIFEDSFEHISDGDVPKEVERMIADIYSMAESASNKTSNNGRSGSNQICRGTYTATGTADIQINDLNKVYVNVANSSCNLGIVPCFKTAAFS